MINRPRIKRLYYGIMKEMIDNQFSSDFLVPYMQKLQAAGVTNTQHGMRNGYVDQRRNRLRAAIRGVSLERIEFAVTTNDGMAFDSDTPVVTIEGTAPVDIFSITAVIDGDADQAVTADFSNADLLGWSATLGLEAGTHSIEFIGYNSTHEPLATASIEVSVGEPTEKFVRGDVDLNGVVNITDAVNTLFHLFNGKQLKCEDAADTNDDGDVNLTDAVATLDYLFKAGAPPASPFPAPGSDRTADGVSCVKGLAL